MDISGGGILEKCDVFIHQDIRPDNSCGYKLSDKYILPQVNVDAQKITVPNLFGFGKMFFPWVTSDFPRLGMFSGRDENGMFPLGNKIIERELEEGKNVDDIVEILNGECLSVQEIYANFEEIVMQIKKREQNWDIKICEFILEHYKEKQMFYDCWHPTEVVLKEIAFRVLEKLGIYDKDIKSTFNLANVEEPTLPCVKAALGMQWASPYIRKGKMTKKISENMTLYDYVREYVWWCHGHM